MRRPSSHAGFTFLETVVVTVVIAVLAITAYFVFHRLQERTRSAQDLQQLRQIGSATQSYLQDNNGNYFVADRTWMAQLNPKYMTNWTILQSPFDLRAPGPDGENSPVSYGLNRNLPGMSSTSVAEANVLIIFAPALDSSDFVSFDGTTDSDEPGVTVLKGASSPGGTSQGGTHAGRKRINVLFGDQRAETISWNDYLRDEHWNVTEAAPP